MKTTNVKHRSSKKKAHSSPYTPTATKTPVEQPTQSHSSNHSYERRGIPQITVIKKNAEIFLKNHSYIKKMQRLKAMSADRTTETSLQPGGFHH